MKLRVADEFIVNCEKIGCQGCEKSKINVILQICLVSKNLDIEKLFLSKI